jgi:hypothetical protein
LRIDYIRCVSARDPGLDRLADHEHRYRGLGLRLASGAS